MKKYVSILGEEWELNIIPKEDDFMLSNCDGYADCTVRKIVVEEMKPQQGTLLDLDKYKRSVIRHEVLHAFLDECGLKSSSDWARNEEMIDFFANQFPKLYKIFKELEVVE